MRNYKELDTTSTVDKIDSWPSNTLVLKEWAHELRGMHAKNLQQHFWKMLGRAPMIVHPNSKERKRLGSLIAHEADIDLVELEGLDFIENVIAGKVPSVKRPTLFFVEQGEWSNKVDDDGSVDDKVGEFREKLSDYLCNLDASYKAVFAIHGPSYESLDVKLRRAGCIDRRLIISKLTLEQSGLYFVEQIGRSICGE